MGFDCTWSTASAARCTLDAPFMDWFGVALQMVAAGVGVLLISLTIVALLTFLRRA